MIAHSTLSRTRRIAGGSLAVFTVGIGLGLTASGSIAAPSQVAPALVKPLFQVQARGLPHPADMVVADRVTRDVTVTSDDADDDAIAPVPPVAPVAPIAPIAPRAPLAPLPPVPPLPGSVLSADQVQQIRDASMQASEIARQAVANIDVAAITREAMAQARAELERECTHARPARVNETDNEAIARLAAGCVDMAEINREVESALSEALTEIHNDKNMSDAERARALAAINLQRSERARHTDR